MFVQIVSFLGREPLTLSSAEIWNEDCPKKGVPIIESEDTFESMERIFKKSQNNKIMKRSKTLLKIQSSKWDNLNKPNNLVKASDDTIAVNAF